MEESEEKQIKKEIIEVLLAITQPSRMEHTEQPDERLVGPVGVNGPAMHMVVDYMGDPPPADTDLSNTYIRREIRRHPPVTALEIEIATDKILEIVRKDRSPKDRNNTASPMWAGLSKS